jgi:hypothetical protein
MRRSGLGFLSIALGLGFMAAFLGCEGTSGTTVTGKVTYDGAPVESGAISFMPVDGQGAAAGATIVNGVYKVDGVPPGKKIVEVVSAAPDPGPMSSEENYKRSQEAPQKAPQTVPQNAAGNGAQHQIGEGEQVLDIALGKPAT